MIAKQKKIFFVVVGLVAVAVVVALAIKGGDGSLLQGRAGKICDAACQKKRDNLLADRYAWCLVHPGEKYTKLIHDAGFADYYYYYDCPIPDVTPSDSLVSSISLSNIVAGGPTDLHFDLRTTIPTRANSKLKVIFPTDLGLPTGFDASDADISDCYWNGQILSHKEQYPKQVTIDYLPAAPAGIIMSCNIVGLINPITAGGYYLNFQLLHDDGIVVEWRRSTVLNIIAPEPPPPPPVDYSTSKVLVTPHVDYSTSKVGGAGIAEEAIETKAVDEYPVQKQNPQLLDSASSATAGAVQDSSSDYSMIRYK